MKPAKIILNVFEGIAFIIFFSIMFLGLEKTILYYLTMNIMWVVFNIDKYYRNIVEEKPNISTRQLKLAKMPYIISIICLVAVIFLEFILDIAIKDRILINITFLNLISNIFGYFLFKHLNKVAMA